MSKVEIRESETMKRGDYLMTVVRDTTRLTNPHAAKIFEHGGEFIVVPENDMFPVRTLDSFSEAVGFVERIIPDESGAFGTRRV